MMEKRELKACPWRLGNSRHGTVGEAQCIKSDCMAWDDKIGCKLIEGSECPQELNEIRDMGETL